MNKMMISILNGMVKFLPFCLFAFLLLTSCSESSEEADEFANWKGKNETYWNNLYATTQKKVAAGDAGWKIIRNWSLEDGLSTANTSYIIVHVLKEGEGKDTPLFTDSARVHYTGRLIASPSYAKGYEFDSSWGKATSASTAIPALFAINSAGLRDGFVTALQNMHIGDEWEVYVPWTLGYGAVKNGSIPAYSILIFNMQLVSFYRAGYDVPEAKAKQQPAWTTE